MANPFLLEAALAYVAAGLSVIPTNPQTKAPTLQTWRPYQRHIPSIAEIHRFFSNLSFAHLQSQVPRRHAQAGVQVRR